MQAQDHYELARVLSLPALKPWTARFHSAARLIALFTVLIPFACASGQSTDPVESEPFSQGKVDDLVLRSSASGNFERGLSVYTQAKAACFSCHRIGSAGGIIGPDLSLTSKQRTPSQLAESLLWPNRLVAPEYQSVKIETTDGAFLTGYISHQDSTEKTLVLKDPATQVLTQIDRAEIERRADGLSLMPMGLVDSLNDQNQADLLAFLVGLGTRADLDLPAIEAIVRSANTHEPATFPLVREPIHPEQHPARTERVNRDRIYDFYTKQATFFSGQVNRPKLLAQFPGVDGATFGHWGNQDEAYWQGEEMNASVQGLVLCNVLVTNPKPIARAVCFRVGPNRAWSACFNPETFAYEKFWTGGFVRYSNVRHGLMDGVRILGTEQGLSKETRSIRELMPQFANAQIQYRGYYVNRDQILFSYSVNGIEYIDAPSIAKGTLKRIVAPKTTHPLRNLLVGGPPQWPQTIDTPITLGTGDGFAIDTIGLPLNNPWKTLLYCGDHAFLSDGSAIVVTLQGDVWRVQGIAYEPSKSDEKLVPRVNSRASWRRIASGLHQALGVVVHEDRIYVLGRNQITRLNDLNGDGECDWYECFSNAFKTSPGGHDYICGLQRDSLGNFYIASGNQGIVQISNDGKDARVIATGLRNPDGFGILPDGTLTMPASEGDWTPASMIYQISPKSSRSSQAADLESNPPPFYGHKGPREGQQIELPLLYLPRGLDNSSGGQVWVDDARMGPLNENMVHTSYGAGRAFLVLRDQVGERWQGAVVGLPGEYRSGVHRAHVNKKDGLLYLSGMNGWGSYTPDPGCFQRLRYTGQDVQMPSGFHVHGNGIAIRFRKPIDGDYAEKASLHFAQCWNYRYSPGYGSKEYSVLHPPMIGHDALTIAASHVLDDGVTLFLEIPELQLCSQLHLRVQVAKEEWQELFATVHAMDSDRTDIANYQPQKEKVLQPHPMTRDLEWLNRSIPNPWLKQIGQARAVRIESRDNLQFSTKTLEVKAGEKIKLTFANPDVVPHNWALLQPGTLEKIGEMTNRLVNDPDAYLRHYVPESKDVICYTDIVNPKEEFSIFFEAPKKPGRYPYLCTFPGHWMVMNGELVVR